MHSRRGQSNPNRCFGEVTEGGWNLHAAVSWWWLACGAATQIKKLHFLLGILGLGIFQPCSSCLVFDHIILLSDSISSIFRYFASFRAGSRLLASTPSVPTYLGGIRTRRFSTASNILYPAFLSFECITISTSTTTFLGVYLWFWDLLRGLGHREDTNLMDGMDALRLDRMGWA